MDEKKDTVFRNSAAAGETRTESFCGVELKNHFGKMP